MWNFNLPDAAFGWVLLDIKDGRVSAEIKAQGIPIFYCCKKKKIILNLLNTNN